LPDSVTVVDYDSDGLLEVRALFSQSHVEGLFTATGPATVRLTGFIDGFELRADATVGVYFPQVKIMAEGSLEGGSIYQVTWPMVFEDPDVTYTLSYSIDSGQAWEEIVSGITQVYYYWTVPDVETTTGLLRVEAFRGGDVILAATSDPFTILSYAGVGGSEGPADRIMLGPNPSRSEFRIQLAVSGNQPVNLDIYTAKGELVKTLVDGRIMSGVGNLIWKGENDQGAPVAPGVYLVVLREGGHTTVKKMILER
jgi:hypothetical protein